MIKLLAKTATALSLMISASVAEPVWAGGKPGSSANCPDAKKKLAAKRQAAPQPARSVMVVEKRKLDVQILSFGP